jgi:Icc-related predicted phosphoesterase
VKLLVLSDLHIEFGDFRPAETGADVVILAGDIWHWAHGLRWAKEQFPTQPMIYVLGNHEFYGHEFHDVVAACRQAAAETGIHFLENDVVVLDGVRFLGAALWTDFALYGERDRSMAHARAMMNDFQEIQIRDEKTGQRRFAPSDFLPLHQVSRAFLEAELAKPFSGKTVVVTHYLPSPHSIAAQYAGDPLTPCFCSDLTALIEAAQPDLWVHGHTHDSFDYRIQHTRVLCNPRGYYPRELNPKFRPDLVVEV